MILWMASYKLTCICFHTICSMGGEPKSMVPNMSPLSTCLLQAALFQVFLKTALDHNSPQHMVTIQSVTSYLLFLANVETWKSKGIKVKGQCRAVLCMVFALRGDAHFDLTICVICRSVFFLICSWWKLWKLLFSTVLERKEMHICSCSETQ